MPCASSKNEPHDINVNWRKTDKLKVCDIVKGKYSVEDQDSAFKNRVKVFPEEYRKGNFSVKLHNLTLMDAEYYWCYITHSSEIVIIQLIVNEAKDKQPPTEEENHAEETKQTGRRRFIPVIVLILFILCIWCLWRKGVNTSSSEFSIPRDCLSCRVLLPQLSKTSEPANIHQ